MRCVVLAAVGASLCACAKRDPLVSTAGATPVGNWRIEKQVDRVTGAPLSSAILMTRSSSNSAVAFAQPAQMQLLCFEDRPMVRFAFDFKVGSSRNSTLGYRFDEKPGHETSARFLANYSTAVIEDKGEVAQFVGELATSNVLYVRIRSLNAGRSSAEFALDGAPAAIEAAFAGCPVTAAKPRPEPARSRKHS
jgi:hypothetical protein